METTFKIAPHPTPRISPPLWIWKLTLLFYNGEYLKLFVFYINIIATPFRFSPFCFCFLNRIQYTVFRLIIKKNVSIDSKQTTIFICFFPPLTPFLSPWESKSGLAINLENPSTRSRSKRLSEWRSVESQAHFSPISNRNRGQFGSRSA